jgi:hypothetical protein
MDALFVTIDGGGNLPPALGIAREIVRRGGTARFLGSSPIAASARTRCGWPAPTRPPCVRRETLSSYAIAITAKSCRRPLW